MKKNFYKIISAILPVILFLVIQGCKDEPIGSLDELIVPGKPAPSITSISPSEAIAAVNQITISGANFSTVANENTIYFNGKKGTVLNSTATQLTVISPVIVSDSVQIKAAVKGADQFSNVVKYKLTAPAEELLKPNGDPVFANNFRPNGIAIDGANNLYASVGGADVVAADVGVKKVPAGGGAAVSFAPKGAETFWVSLKVAPDGTLYGAKNQPRGIWKITEGVAPPNSPWGNISASLGSNTKDIDQDKNLNVWAVGNVNNIIRFTKDAVIKSFPFPANLISVRVFNDALYVAGNKDNIEGVWKFQISGTDDIGEAELYFNFTDFDNSGSKINAITFAADGDLYLGTNRVTDPVIVVHPDKSGEVFYAGAFPANTEILNFAWDTGNYLYFTRNAFGSSLSQSVLKINMQKPGAPYFGR